MVKIVIIITLILGIIMAVVLVTTGSLKLFSNASEDGADLVQYPPDALITNITDTSFTIVYFTPHEPVETKVSVGTDPKVMEKLAGDDRGSGSRHIHYVTLKNLQPDSTYYVLIEPGVTDPLRNEFIEQKTAPKLSGINFARIESFFGRVIGKLDPDFTDNVVFFKTENGQTLSMFTDDKGSFKFDLKNYRTRDLTEYYPVSKIDEVDFLAIGSLDGVSYLKTYGYGNENEIELPLEMPRIPFYMLQLGEPGSDRAELPASDSAKTARGESRNFFETIWIYIKNFFSLK